MQRVSDEELEQLEGDINAAVEMGYPIDADAQVPLGLIADLREARGELARHKQGLEIAASDMEHTGQVIDQLEADLAKAKQEARAEAFGEAVQVAESLEAYNVANAIGKHALLTAVAEQHG